MDAPVRKHLRRIEVARWWRFVTFSCHRRLPLFGNARIRDELVRSIAAARERCDFRVLAWVIMPEHVHLIVALAEGKWTMPRVLTAIKQPVAQLVINRWRRMDAPVLKKIMCDDGRTRFWQAGGGFDRNVRDQDELAREVEYIHNNPVKRGLVTTPTDWAWSSARWYAGEGNGPISIDHDPRW